MIVATVTMALLLAGAVGANSRVATTPPPETVDNYTMAFLNFTFLELGGKRRNERSEVAKFGESHVHGSSGLLVRVTSSDGEDTGCSLPLRNSGNGRLPSGPWIALVKRGGCNFQVKVDNAFSSNASGIIVYNDRESTTLDKMRLTNKKHGNFSAVFTFKWKGEELARTLANGTVIFANISVASFCARPFTPLNRSSVLFVSISFVVLMIISLAWLVFYYVQRFRYIHAKDRLSKRLCSAAKKALSKIPTKHIRAEDKEMEGDGECCAVCIEPFKLSDVLRILPCRHEFHRTCIDPWLLEHRTCPMCKMDILKHYGFVFTGSQESILDIDTEETISESESLQQSNLSPVPPITSSEVQVSDIQSNDRDTYEEEEENSNQNMHTDTVIISDAVDGTTHSQSDLSSEELLLKTQSPESVNDNGSEQL